ncbi:puromycin-sensitive aminopeptidase-like protein, partial [Trifolium pratense]
MDQFKGQPRLPKFAVPNRYDIRLKPDLIACRFSGSVSVNLDIVTATNFIVLNAAELSVTNDSVSFTNRDSSKVFKPSKVELFEDDEILVLEFSEQIPTGLGVLSIQFEGTLNDRMKVPMSIMVRRRIWQLPSLNQLMPDVAFLVGMNLLARFIYSPLVEKKNMAVTHYEAQTLLRLAVSTHVSCPVSVSVLHRAHTRVGYKKNSINLWLTLQATFKITLDVPSDLVALSNMPVAEEKIDNNLKTVSYQESPIMSTYLVAVVVGLFDYVEDHTPDGIKVRVYCQVGKANQGKFALDVAVKTLGIYKDYFDTPYTLPKLDMIAIPDFAAGAMENYGLVTYRETALLYDDQHSAAANKQRVAVVVAHELAHQWFGNLVTMEWWTHLWLNEGFATWVSYLAADGLFPDWKIWSQFLHECTDGLKLDGLAESHPIEVEINHAREIDEIFDAISYRKGASVIRMLQSYLGAQIFQRSLASYIKRHACSNAKTEDLWAALEEGSGEPVNKLMTSWTKQQGYPVVSVKLNNQNLEFDQSQFLSSGAQGEGHWIIPITLCFGSYDVRKNFLLQTKSETRDIKELLGSQVDGDKSANSWIKLNVDQAGFYRVKYDELLTAKLRYAVEKRLLSPSDRFGILDDSYALSMAGKESLTSLINLMGAYREEDDYTVLSNLITISHKVQRIAADAVPDLLEYFKLFFFKVFQYSAERLGWDPKPGESHDDALLRGEILTSLAQFGHDLTLDEASKRFQAFLEDRNTPLLPPDLRRAVYVAVMKRASKSNRSGYESLLKVYRETDLSQEKTRILGSLASSSDPELILEVLNFMLSSEVRSQDAVFGLSVNWEGRDVAWAWLK